MSGAKAKPTWIIGAALLWSSLSGAFLMVQELFSDSLFPPLPVLGDGATAVIAHWCVALMCGAFFIAGAALLLSRRVAMPFFVTGMVFYIGYITSAFLIAFIQGAPRVAGGFLYAVLSASGFSLLVAGIVFIYLFRLSQSGVLR